MRLVSAICPTTYARRHYLPQAINCFLAQTYPNKTLLILDDQEDPHLVDLIPVDPRIRYYRRPKGTIGAKLNTLCELAEGDIIWRLDDDDFSSALRMESQVRLLLQSNQVLVGFSSCLWWDEVTGSAWSYQGYSTPNYYALGTSLTFLRSWWRVNQFSDGHLVGGVRVGSDNDMVRKARGRMLSVPAGPLLVARNHAGSSNRRKFVEDEYWRPVAREVLPAEFLKLIEVS